MTMTPALLVTRDDAVLEDVLRLAAAAGVPLDVAHDTAAALRSWGPASVVLVAADQATVLARGRPPLRDHVHVLTRDQAPDALFRDALALGARDVLELPAADDWVVELLTDALDGAQTRACSIGVVAGSGGAGASTFACALAAAGARTAPALLLDLDAWGPGLDRVAGLDDAAGVRWHDLTEASGRLSSRSLRDALPGRDLLSVLTFGSAPGRLESDAVREVVSAGRRGSGLLVVDLPRSLDGSAAEVAVGCDLVVLVAQTAVSSVASSVKVATRLRDLGARVGLVVRTSAGSLSDSAVAEALQLPLLASYPTRARVHEQLELGLGPPTASRSPLVRAARSVLDAVGAPAAVMP